MRRYRAVTTILAVFLLLEPSLLLGGTGRCAQAGACCPVAATCCCGSAQPESALPAAPPCCREAPPRPVAAVLAVQDTVLPAVLSASSFAPVPPVPRHGYRAEYAYPREAGLAAASHNPRAPPII